MVKRKEILADSYYKLRSPRKAHLRLFGMVYDFMPFLRGGAYANGSFSAKSFFANSLAAEEDEIRESGDRRKAFMRLEVCESLLGPLM